MNADALVQTTGSALVGLSSLFEAVVQRRVTRPVCNWNNRRVCHLFTGERGVPRARSSRSHRKAMPLRPELES
jgi:hypothetical protein